MYVLVIELPNFNKKNNSSTYENEIKMLVIVKYIKIMKSYYNFTKKSKDSRMTIKPSLMHQKGSFSTKVDYLFESVKEKTSDYFHKAKIKQHNINSFGAGGGGVADNVQMQVKHIINRNLLFSNHLF